MTALVSTSTRGAEIKDAQKIDCAHFLPYSPDREHIWNRVHRRLFERTTRGGKILGCDELDLLLWIPTVHVLAEPAYSETVRLLDDFIANHDERLVRDRLRRAIFQRDLWAFFDWLAVDPSSNPDFRKQLEEYRQQREQLARRVATIIRSVALTRAEIEQLPDNLDQLRASRAPGELSELPDPAEGWVLFGRDDGSPAAPFHANEVSPRSVFLVLLRLPGGGATAPYLERLRAYSRTRPAEEDCRRRRCNPPQFPAGTQVALVRRAMLIDVNGQPVPSPITETVQLRRYLGVPAVPRGYLDDAAKRAEEGSFSPQQFAEFRLRRSLLLQGKSSLHRLGMDETGEPSSGRFTFSFIGDPIDRYGESVHMPLHSCAGCHVGPGVIGFMSYSQLFEGRHFLSPRSTTESEEEGIAIKHLESLSTWKLLEKLMPPHQPVPAMAPARRG